MKAMMEPFRATETAMPLSELKVNSIICYWYPETIGAPPPRRLAASALIDQFQRATSGRMINL